MWLLRAFLFFVLFAFALNNQHPATLHWFFGLQSQAPMVLVVLVAFAAGAVLGVLAMVPKWWRSTREMPQPQPPKERIEVSGGRQTVLPPPDIEPQHPPRDGL